MKGGAGLMHSGSTDSVALQIPSILFRLLIFVQQTHYIVIISQLFLYFSYTPQFTNTLPPINYRSINTESRSTVVYCVWTEFGRRYRYIVNKRAGDYGGKVASSPFSSAFAIKKRGH